MDDDFKVPASSSGPRELPDEGLAHSVCVAVVDMGDCLDDFPGKPPRVVRKARFFFELQQCMSDGRPMMLSTSGITLSSHEKGNLSKTLKGWLGKECPASITGFPLKTLVGRHATLNVIHKEKGNGELSARIEKILPAQKGSVTLKPAMTALPPWVEKEKAENIQKVANFRRAEATAPADDDGITPIPF